MSEEMRKEFEDWYWGIENFSMRAEYCPSPADAAWAAWQVAIAKQPLAAWQPIETAPETTESKDVLLSGKFGVHLGKVFNYGGGDIVVVIAHIAGNAVEGISHFMVIPAAPKEPK